MKGQVNYYKYYEKLIKMNLEQSIVKTPEFRSLSEIYPDITESIKLRRELQRLTRKFKLEKNTSTKIKMKREINIIKTKLRKNNLFKRLHGENKQEAIFQRTMKLKSSKKIFSKFRKRYDSTFGKSVNNFRKKLRKSLPPSILSLRELDVTEKGLALSEWIREKSEKNQ